MAPSGARIGFGGAIGAVLALAAGAALLGTAAAQTVLIHAGTLIADARERPQRERTIVIEDGRVRAIENGYRTRDGATVIDLKDKTVLPGLIDGHVHILGELGPSNKTDYVEQSDPDVAFAGARFARRTLMGGFTTVRDLGATGGDAIFALRDAINRGDVVGSRIYAAGAVISPTGGHGQRHGYRREILDLMKSPGVCDGPADCRRAVRLQVNRGADQIKFVATGGVLSETAAGTGQQFFDDEIEAIIDAAHAMGRKVTAHAHDKEGIETALRLGVDSIEHSSFADDETFALYKRTGAYLVPTLLAGATVTEMATPDDTFMSPAVRAKALDVGPALIDMLRAAHRAGVKIAFGTDSGVSAHGVNAEEFLLMEKAGMSPKEALVAATVSVADNMGVADLGQIGPGFRADIIAVDGDPLRDLSTLLEVDFVMKDGDVHKRNGAMVAP